MSVDLDFGSVRVPEPIHRALTEMGFTEPTPVQEQAIPPALAGKDLLVQSQTGTGKTAAFAIPLIETAHAARLAEPENRQPIALVLLPTRELALQVAEEVTRVGVHREIATLAVYGGVSIERQIQELRRGTPIVVGTPGRIKDHLTRGTLSLASVRVLVLDEADAMLDMGFIHDIEWILNRVPKQRQTLLFSATLPEEVRRIALRYMRDPDTINLSPADPCATGVEQLFYHVTYQDKVRVLTQLLRQLAEGLTLVFCQTKREVDLVTAILVNEGIQAEALHGDYSQAKREQVLGRFRQGVLPVLVATDVAARGIHVGEVNQVLNYSLPSDPNRYIHRIGRTGRAGRTGVAVTLVTAHDLLLLRMIERVAKTRVSLLRAPAAAS